MGSRAQTTKGTYPLACDAIREGRYRVEYLKTDSIRGVHPQFGVFVGPTLVHACDGAGTALSWIQTAVEKQIARGARRI